ncbi:MAG: LON peptidase substrate-binding domain-containing protein [Microlunatus sp.]|nr:LON peptidase substrate-binding domain-containing protein [Microlunatus sp.]MDN5770956.1 LON peptidase substrate-binding domain-containing protein [Microlunatus sp.]MDN5803367.1 LON peptidase substrate-binding domain-containing protein [Microlunatus sp.]
MAILPMFPLGSVLFPHMPLRLRVFEQRYLVMLSTLLQGDDARFGVVLIERGQEVGGGEQRFTIGTVAEITTLGTQDGFIGLLAEGRTRFRVVQWLADEPHPQAEVEPVPELVWQDRWTSLLTETERSVRRSLAVASEFSDHTWPADIAVEHDPVAAAWQLAGVAPIGPLDQVGLLAAESAEDLLVQVRALCDAISSDLTAPWPDQR